jgi:hypothetical protein
LPAFRGTGLGRRLLDETIDEAKRQGMRHVHLHAQTHAAGFYRKAGFLPVGGEFMEAGIAHQAMELELPIPFESPGTISAPRVRPEVSERERAPTSDPAAHHGEGDCLEALLTALRWPRRSLLIMSQQLDHALFDAQALVDSISEFARSRPSADVRILVSDTSLVVSRGHRLVELARRLDSRISIRRINDDIVAGEQSFVTWDSQGYFVLPDFREYDALTDRYDPVQARRLQDAFEYLWARSSPDPELRMLSL